MLRACLESILLVLYGLFLPILCCKFCKESSAICVNLRLVWSKICSYIPKNIDPKQALRKLFIFAFVLLSQVLLHAQVSSGEKQEKIEQIKMDFLKQKMDLSASEAQAFWPVYNDFQQKRESLRKQRDEAFKKEKDNVDALSDKDAELFADNELSFKQKDVDLQKDFEKKLKLIISSKKIAKYYLAEEEFRRKLAELIKQK